MEKELKELKSKLRAIVVSSRKRVDIKTLLLDFKEMVDTPLPYRKFGYSNALTFLKEECDDCFLIQGFGSNPELILIVPDALKDIHKSVQNYSASNFNKKKGVNAIIKPGTDHGTYGTSNGAVKKTKQIANPVSASPVPLRTKLRMLQTQLKDLIDEKSEAVWCTNLVDEYSEKYGHAPYVEGFAIKTAVDLLRTIDGVSVRQELCGGWLVWASDRTTPESLRPRPPPPPAFSTLRVPERDTREARRLAYVDVPSFPPRFPPPPALSAPRARGCKTRKPRCSAYVGFRTAGTRTASPAPKRDPDDALPGFPYERGVFPEDCMQPGEKIPELSLEDVHVEDKFPVLVKEVYSPSHFWMIRLGEEHDMALKPIEHQMIKFYNVWQGALPKRLGWACVMEGHYCTTINSGKWHRAVIVRILSSERVKVRFVDYGSVKTVDVSSLYHLRRCWAQLPAQAIRARLGHCAPVFWGEVRFGSPVWPLQSTTAFLAKVPRHNRLVAQVLALHSDNVLEVLLLYPSMEINDSIQHRMKREGQVDWCGSPMTRWASYQVPTFYALENALAPSYAELEAYVRDRIDLESVEEYRRYVLDAMPRP